MVRTAGDKHRELLERNRVQAAEQRLQAFFPASTGAPRWHISWVLLPNKLRALKILVRRISLRRQIAVCWQDVNLNDACDGLDIGSEVGIAEVASVSRWMETSAND